MEGMEGVRAMEAAHVRAAVFEAKQCVRVNLLPLFEMVAKATADIWNMCFARPPHCRTAPRKKRAWDGADGKSKRRKTAP